jgi:hypothetical protein
MTPDNKSLVAHSGQRIENRKRYAGSSWQSIEHDERPILQHFLRRHLYIGGKNLTFEAEVSTLSTKLCDFCSGKTSDSAEVW